MIRAKPDTASSAFIQLGNVRLSEASAFRAGTQGAQRVEPGGQVMGTGACFWCQAVENVAGAGGVGSGGEILDSGPVLGDEVQGLS